MKLSICIPTRNRQRLCLSAIQELVRLGLDEESNVEVVVVDNSDDKSLLPNLCKSSELIGHSWLNLIESENHVLSMRQNWQRAAMEASGEWVCFIGDDDFVDFRIVHLLAQFESVLPDLEYFTWRRIGWEWPNARTKPAIVVLPLGSKLLKSSSQTLRNQILSLSGNKKTGRVMGGFSPYHGCTRRSLIKKVIDLSPGQDAYFFYDNVDYFTGVLQTFLTEEYVLSIRPFSIAGVSQESNSYGWSNRSALSDRLQSYLREDDDDDCTVASSKNASFAAHYDVVPEFACIDYLLDALLLLGQISDRKRHAVKHAANIINGLIRSQSSIPPQNHLEKIVATTSQIILDNFGTEAQQLYTSKMTVDSSISAPAKLNRGLRHGGDPANLELRVPPDFGSCNTAGQFYRLVEQLLEDPLRVGS